MVQVIHIAVSLFSSYDIYVNTVSSQELPTNLLLEKMKVNAMQILLLCWYEHTAAGISYCRHHFTVNHVLLTISFLARYGIVTSHANEF